MAKTNVKVNLIDQDGNIFNLLGICSRELKRAGHKDLADEMINKVYAAESYDEALRVLMEYCDIE